MIEGIVAALILITAFVVVRSVVSNKHHEAPPGAPTVQKPPTSKISLIPEETMVQLTKTEEKVFGKAAEAKRIADHESAIFPPVLEAEMPPITARNPLEETALLKSITKKVEQVKKLSGEQEHS